MSSEWHRPLAGCSGRRARNFEGRTRSKTLDLTWLSAARNPAGRRI